MAQMQKFVMLQNDGHLKSAGLGYYVGKSGQNRMEGAQEKAHGMGPWAKLRR
jgi:hypothetical protein